jgi:hypothetical protein
MLKGWSIYEDGSVSLHGWDELVDEALKAEKQTPKKFYNISVDGGSASHENLSKPPSTFQPGITGGNP